MSHEKRLQDGKKKKESTKSLKERRAEKKSRHNDLPHARKPRAKKTLIESF